MARRAAWLGLLGGLCITAYLLAAMIGAIRTQGAPSQAPHSGDVTLHLLRGPIHYDFLLPNDARTRTAFDWLAAEGIALNDPRADWIVMGWGGRDFYTTIGTYRDVTARAVWRGLTGDAAVLRVSLAGQITPDWRTRAVHMTHAQYDLFLDFLQDSFAHGPSTPALDQPGFGTHDRFFPAKGQFHIFNTCNVWVGAALRAADLPFGTWTPAPFSVTLAHRLHLAP